MAEGRYLAAVRACGPEAALWRRTAGLDTGSQPEYAPDRARSDLERDLFAICRDEGLPLPEQNVEIGPYEVDFLWREERLVIETDGWETHGTRTAFEADRARDADLTIRGYRPVRLTHRQVSDLAALRETLCALLLGS